MRKTVLILAVIFAGINPGRSEEKHVLKSEPVVGYYPLKIGNFWEYRDKSNLHGYYLRKEVVDFCLVQGGIGV